MTPERWQQIRDVLEKALELAPGERSVYLNRVCSADASLRQEVETLLASSDDVRSSFLQAPPPRVTLSTGTKLGEYEIKSMLGAGGMGEVYRARDARLGRDVAIKVLPALMSADADRLRRFEQEARAAAALNHPNILAVFQMGTFEGAPYLVSELLEGETLREPLRRGKLVVRKAIDYGVQIARGLSAAHEKGIVHRDLKPENLFVTKDGRVKILDFGLAKLTQPQPGFEHSAPTVGEETEPGAVMGTVGYMSPEQVRGQNADHRTDIFSFGTILYEMLAGKRAFEKATAADTQSAILNEDPVSISQVTTSIPPALQRMVHRCLEKNPDQRFQNASDLAFALEAMSGELSSASGSATAQVRQKSKIWLKVAVLLVASAGITLGFYHWRAPKPVPFQKTQITQLTTKGYVTVAAISPDGRYVAYVTNDSGFGASGSGANSPTSDNHSLWVRQVATGSEVQVSRGDETYLGLTFSRDGDFLYAVRSDPKDIGYHFLYKIPALGGKPKKLIADVDSKVILSPDGKQLVFIRNSSARNDSAVVIANVDGSGERRLAARKPLYSYQAAAWSPDGRAITIAVRAYESGAYHYHLIETPVQGGAERPLTQKQWAWLGDLEWIPDGRGLIFEADENQGSGTRQFGYLSLPSGEVRSITNDLTLYDGLSLSSDSRALVTVQAERSSDVFAAPFAEADRAKPITSGGHTEWPAWTPDGKIVCTRSTGNAENVWVMEADGSNAKQLTMTTEGGIDAPRVSPDGRYVVFSSLPDSNIWRIDIDGNNAQRLTNNESSSHPDLSPDGKWVVYADLGTGRGIFKVPIDGGDSVRLSSEAFDPGAPAVSPDGRRIAYYYRNMEATPKQGVAVMAFEGGPPVRRFDMLPRTSFRWAADGQSLLYANNEGAAGNIWSQPISGEPPKQITHFTSEFISSFDLSRDGKQLVIDRGIENRYVLLIRDIR
jgi:eukaryotic-like serine/threonine-protein kinase